MLKSPLFAVASSLAVASGVVFGAAPAESPRGADRPIAASARATLEAWRAEHARPSERRPQVVCWTPSDRPFPADHRARLGRMLDHIRDFYAKEMDRHGFGPLTFELPRDAEGRLAVHEVIGAGPTNRYGKKSGREIREECLPTLRKAGLDPDAETIAIFCNLATWDERASRFTHESPYYAGGTYRAGTAWQLDSPELDVTNLVKTEPLLHDGQYGRISLGRHNSIFIGGMAHELGHAFGLPHCKERPDEAPNGTALMGSGNRTYGEELRGEGRGSFLTLVHALRLSSHPLFCRVQEQRQNEPRFDVRDLAIHADGSSIEVRGRVSGEPPVYAVVAYFDPEGHDDYDATTASSAVDAEGRFSLSSGPLERGKRGRLRIIPLHANGAIASGATLARVEHGYAIKADGTPDLAAIETRLALAPIVTALAAGDKALAARLASEVKSPAAAEIAAALVAERTPTRTPARFDGDAAAVALTEFLPTSEKVGWIRPAYDRLPDESVLLESADGIHATGIYAHAPAEHVYTLGRGWSRLSGKVGLAAGHRGSVQFTIRGDDRELWKSPVVEADRTAAFDVDVSGVERLELLVSPTDDGPTDDWGLWLEPTVRRAAKP